MSRTWWRNADELVPEQANLLAIPATESLLIQGPPGSGKTNLLLLRANQLYLGHHPNLHIVVFGRLLKDFIQMGGLQYKFPEEKIITHAGLFNSILQSENLSFVSTGMSLEDARKERLDRIIELLKTKKIGKMYDALLLDEAQDYYPEEIEILSQISNVLVAAADDKQRIYDIPSCIDTIEGFVNQTYKLKYHFRNGIEICRLADGIQNGSPGYVNLTEYINYKEADYPSKVTVKRGISIEQQIEAIAEQIKDQRLAYPDELIAILCPRNREVDLIFNGLAAQGFSELITRANIFDEFDSDKPIWLSSLTAAKGLEFRAVHIAGLDFLPSARGAQKRLIYTGITRAKTALTLYWDERVPGYLESAILSIAPKKQNVTMKNIFGGS